MDEDCSIGPSCEMAMKVVNAILRARTSCSKGRRVLRNGIDGSVVRVTRYVSRRTREVRVKKRHYIAASS